MYSFWSCLLILVLFLAGCSTSHRSVSKKDEVSAPEYTQPETNKVPTVITNAPEVVVKPSIPQPVVTNRPITTNVTVKPFRPAPPRAPEIQSAWIDLNRWTSQSKKATLRQTGSGTYPSYRLQSTRGTLDFTIKNQMARWNGLSFMLGFAPLSDHGKPFIQSLDLENTLVPLMDETHNRLKNKIVVIDPGHGGDQLGTQSCSGPHYEKEYTLDWALRVQNLLTNAGWKVVLTRTNDIDVPLTNRVMIADNANASLFISLHFNSLVNRDQSGLETYCLTPAGMPSNLVRGSEEQFFQPNNAYDHENLYWAMQLHRQLVRGTRAPDRGVRRARFLAVLRTQKRPAVLIEGGYLSNRKESELISTPAYRQKLAEAVAKAITKQ